MAGTVNEARVEEQSHKSEMRAALQGDFERLRARRRTGGDAEAERSLPERQAEEPSAPAPPAPATSWLDRLRGHR